MNATQEKPQQKPKRAREEVDALLSRMVIRLALVHLKRLKQRQRAYEEEVDAWYRSGEGRSPRWRTEVDEETGAVYQVNYGGRGYRFPECPHGRSLWTDYDNICGPCEDGYSVYELALIAAHNDYETFMNRMSVAQYALDQHVPKHIVDQITEWALDTLPEEWRQ